MKWRSKFYNDWSEMKYHEFRYELNIDYRDDKKCIHTTD